MTGSISPDSVNILIVEDDDIDAEVVRRAFKKQKLGSRIFHARCGVDALDMLLGRNGQQKVPQPYIMLVDVNMPQMNGIEFLQQVRSNEGLKNSVAFMLSTSQSASDIAAAYKLSAGGYFLKDEVGELIAMLGAYMKINRFSHAG